MGNDEIIQQHVLGNFECKMYLLKKECTLENTAHKSPDVNHTLVPSSIKHKN
jgi:hypothetical protein